MPALSPSGYSSPGISPQGNSGGASDKGYSVEKLRRQYLDYETTKIEEIKEQQIARHYYHADQWTSEEAAVLKARGQPIVTNNLIGRKIDGTVGLIERLRQDPKAFPRKPMPPQQQGGPQGAPQPQQGNGQSPTPEGADIATEVLRYVLDAQDWQQISSNAARDGAINGLAGMELSIEQGDHGDPDVGLAPVDPDTYFYDPRSRRFDFSDARFQGIAKWVDLELAQEMFPDQSEVLEGLVNTTGDSLSQQQQDNRLFAVNSTLRRVFLIEHWYLKGKEWFFCFYVGSTELMSGKSPFIDEKTKSFCRFIMFSVNIDHDGDRYGLVRNLRPLQDEVNHRRSKGQHVLNTRRIIMEEGAVQDVEKVRKEAVRPDGVMVVNPNKRFEFDDNARLADLAGQVAALEEAKGQIENFGPSRALIGQGSESQSGRAIALLQQAGIAELGPFILAYRGWKIRGYRAVWNTAQRIWTSERWLRVTDDEGKNFVPLNQLRMNQYGQPEIVNHLGSLDVDIILDEGPDTTTMMEDILETLQSLAQKNGTPIPPQVIIELAPLPNSMKKKILGLLNQPNPMQQITQDQATADVQKTLAETAKIKTEAAATVHNVLHEVASTGMGEGGPAPAPPPAQKPSESIAFKDLPPEGQSQMASQVGIRLTPESLAAHAADQAKQQAALKAANKPQPQPQSPRTA